LFKRVDVLVDLITQTEERGLCILNLLNSVKRTARCSLDLITQIIRDHSGRWCLSNSVGKVIECSVTVIDQNGHIIECLLFVVGCKHSFRNENSVEFCKGLQCDFAFD
jgi:hypothetical protein